MTKTNSDYRRLTDGERAQLARQGCYCDDWSLLLVAKGFDAARVWQTTFAGFVRLGSNVTIRRAEIVTEGCDNAAMRAEVLCEDGSMWVELRDDLSYNTWRDALCVAREGVTVTTIGDNATITSGAIVRNSIVCAHAVVSDCAIVERCFVGQGSHIGKGFTANDCLVFSNCELEKGEACASVCGPHTVSHHKSTLIIGCQLSFANLGSGTNMSNHRYKLGPVHHGSLGKGCKTASGAHLVMPVWIGDFTMVMGKVSHADTRALPFSYLFGEGGKTYLVPAVNAFTVGTYRDLKKWAKRDRRPADNRLDHIDYAILTKAYVEQQVSCALAFLREKAETFNPTTDEYTCGAFCIKRKDYGRGILLYTKLLALANGEPEAKEYYRQAIIADLRKELCFDSQLEPQVQRLEAEINHDFETN